MKTIEETARLFHDTYERLAPQFGYETRPDTKSFDPSSANGRLMMAVCEHVAAAVRREALEECRRACLMVGEDASEAAKANDAHTYCDGYMDAAVDCDEAIRSIQSPPSP